MRKMRIISVLLSYGEVKTKCLLLLDEISRDEEYTARAYGLDRLAEVMVQVIPDSVKKTFTAIQCADLNMKIDQAKSIVGVAAATVAATATGASPIPLSDAALLVPEELAMLAKITAIFRLPIAKGTLSIIISGTIGTAGATAALGEVYIAILVQICKGNITMSELESERGKQKVKEIFNSRLKVKRDKKGQPK